MVSAPTLGSMDDLDEKLLKAAIRRKPPAERLMEAMQALRDVRAWAAAEGNQDAVATLDDLIARGQQRVRKRVS